MARWAEEARAPCALARSRRRSGLRATRSCSTIAVRSPRNGQVFASLTDHSASDADAAVGVVAADDVADRAQRGRLHVGARVAQQLDALVEKGVKVEPAALAHSRRGSGLSTLAQYSSDERARLLSAFELLGNTALVFIATKLFSAVHCTHAPGGAG